MKQKKNNIYGPYSPDDWYTMLSLREDLRFMRDSKLPKYELPIRYTLGKLKEYYRKAA